MKVRELQAVLAGIEDGDMEVVVRWPNTLPSSGNIVAGAAVVDWTPMQEYPTAGYFKEPGTKVLKLEVAGD
jgi:hypothetical protein